MESIYVIIGIIIIFVLIAAYCLYIYINSPIVKFSEKDVRVKGLLCSYRVNKNDIKSVELLKHAPKIVSYDSISRRGVVSEELLLLPKKKYHGKYNVLTPLGKREVNMVVANNDKPCVEVKTDSMIYCFNYNDEMQTKDLYNRICMLSKQ